MSEGGNAGQPYGSVRLAEISIKNSSKTVFLTREKKSIVADLQGTNGIEVNVVAGVQYANRIPILIALFRFCGRVTRTYIAGINVCSARDMLLIRNIEAQHEYYMAFFDEGTPFAGIKIRCPYLNEAIVLARERASWSDEDFELAFHRLMDRYETEDALWDEIDAGLGKDEPEGQPGLRRMEPEQQEMTFDFTINPNGEKEPYVTLQASAKGVRLFEGGVEGIGVISGVWEIEGVPIAMILLRFERETPLVFLQVADIANAGDRAFLDAVVANRDLNIRFRDTETGEEYETTIELLEKEPFRDLLAEHEQGTWWSWEQFQRAYEELLSDYSCDADVWDDLFVRSAE